VDTAKDQRNRAGHECANDDARYDQPGLTQTKRRDRDSTRLDEECQPQRRGKAGAVGEMSGENRADRGAKSE